MIHFNLDGLPPNLNNSTRQHWTKQAREVKAWRERVVLTVRALRLARDVTMPAAVILEVHCRGDAENHVKATVDGLVSAGLLYDDRFPFVIELSIRGRPQHGQAFTKVWILDDWPEGRPDCIKRIAAAKKRAARLTAPNRSTLLAREATEPLL